MRLFASCLAQRLKSKNGHVDSSADAKLETSTSLAFCRQLQEADMFVQGGVKATFAKKSMRSGTSSYVVDADLASWTTGR